mgnify:FL=1
MTNTERVAYIRGLTEGLELDADKKEVKVINAIIDLLDDMALSISEAEDNMNDMTDQLDAVDEDLGSLEEDFYEDDEDDEDDSDDEDDDTYYEVTCPNCNETVCLTEDILSDGHLDCPNCGTPLEFELDDSCDCGCCDTEDTDDSKDK